MKRNTYQIALKRLNEYLRAHDKRPSVPRALILERICEMPQPFAAKDLATLCENDGITTATVYNSLELFTSAQILHVTKRQRGHFYSEYELSIGSVTRMQIICQKCGRTTTFHDKVIERLMQEKHFPNFNMHDFTLIAYGECKRCRKKT